MQRASGDSNLRTTEFTSVFLILDSLPFQVNAFPGKNISIRLWLRATIMPKQQQIIGQEILVFHSLYTHDIYISKIAVQDINL